MRAKETLRCLLTISLLGILLLDCQASSNSEIIKSDGEIDGSIFDKYDEFSSTRMPENFSENDSSEEIVAIRTSDEFTEPEDEVSERTARGLPILQPYPQMMHDIPFAMAYPNAVPCSPANPAALSPMPVTHLPMGSEPYHVIGNRIGHFIGSIIGDVRTLMRHAEIIFLNLNHQLSLGTHLAGGISGYATTQTRMKQFLEIASRMLGLLRKEPFHLLAVPDIVRSTAPAKLIVGTLRHLLGVIGKLFVFIEERLAHHTQMGNLDMIKALGKRLMSIDVSGFSFLDNFLRSSGSPTLAPPLPASCGQPLFNSAIPTDAAIDGAAEVASSLALGAINEVTRIPNQIGEIVRSFQTLLTTLGVVPSIVYQFLVLVRSVLGTNTFAAGILDHPVVCYLHELNSGPGASLLEELATIAGGALSSGGEYPSYRQQSPLGHSLYNPGEVSRSSSSSLPQKPPPGPSNLPGATMTGPSSWYPSNGGTFASGGGYPSYGQQSPLGHSLYNPGEISGSSSSSLPQESQPGPSNQRGATMSGPSSWYPSNGGTLASGGEYPFYGQQFPLGHSLYNPEDVFGFSPSSLPYTLSFPGGLYSTGPGYPPADPSYAGLFNSYGNTIESNKASSSLALSNCPLASSNVGSASLPHNQYPRSLQCPDGSCNSDSPAPDNVFVSIPVHNSGLEPPLNEYPHPGHSQLPTYVHSALIPPNVGGFYDPGRINDPGPSSIINPFVDEASLANYILLTLPTETIQRAFPTATISPGDLISIDLGDLSLVGRLIHNAKSIDLKILTVPLRVLKANLEPGTSSWEIRCENFNDGVCREVFNGLHDNL